MLMATALCLMMAGVIAYVSMSSPRAVQTLLRHWALALVYQGVGWVLYALRGSIPDVLAVVAANLFLLWAFVEMNRAIRLYLGLPRAGLRDLGLLIALLVGLGVFLYIWDSMTVRIVLATLAFSWVTLDSVRVLWRYGPAEWPPTYRVVAFFLLLPIAVLIARAVNQVLGVPIQSAMAVQPLQMVMHFTAVLSPLGGALGFVLMVGTRLQDELRDAANSDPLTGLLNRRHLEELATPLMAQRAVPMSVLMVDADHFKAINDRLGHEGGDEALCWLTSHLRVHARASDVIARLGGEEFVLLLPDTDLTAARQLAERLRNAVSEAPFLLAEEVVTLTISIGVAKRTPEDRDFSDVLRRADEALYRAKAGGRDRVEVAL